MRVKMFAVIGHPIRHSLSPVMHNAAFRKLGLECEYDAFDVIKEELDKRMDDFRTGGFTGINVTIPHKVDVMRYMNSLSEDAALIGAVNTVKFGKKTVGYNTDGVGCLRAFEEAGVKPSGKRVLILGAGGAGRAIALKLAKEKAAVVITDQIPGKALELAGYIRENTGGTADAASPEEGTLEREIGKADILINATPAGMWPNTGETPVNPKIIREGMVVMDIVYNPAETKLLKEAKEKGCRTISGVGMFVHQGAESLRIWLGVEPPVDAMRNAVLNALKTT
jgi:shikimate dehydrogenase